MESKQNHRAVANAAGNTNQLTTIFFEQQIDLLSEIVSFLDLQSMLKMCNATKTAASCLRYEHVFSSTRKKSAVNAEDKVTRKMERNSIIILNKLANIYDFGGNHTTDTSTKNENTITTQWMKSTTPSPLRLLRLVNGRRCERCHRDLVSPCVWAGNSGFGQAVLPSLSFGEFCCTQCIFDSKCLVKGKKHRSHSPSSPKALTEHGFIER